MLLVGTFLVWVGSLTNYKFDLLIWISCELGYFLLHFGFSYSSVLLIIISTEKCFALYFPFKTMTFCTVKIARRVSLVTAVLHVALNSQFFYFSTKITNERGTHCEYYGEEKYLKVVFNIFSALYSYATFIIMSLANFAIIYKFIKAKLTTGQASTESTSQALSKSATRGTGMLLAVSFAFIILTGPISVLQLFIEKQFPNWIFDIAHVLQNLNHGINGILYCVAGSRFRNELKKMFFCGKDNHQQSFTHTAVLSSKSEST